MARHSGPVLTERFEDHITVFTINRPDQRHVTGQVIAVSGGTRGGPS
ncbi:hypothetical protein ABZV58_29455 [Nocardia sp. NPDC004654]